MRWKRTFAQAFSTSALCQAIAMPCDLAALRLMMVVNCPIDGSVYCGELPDGLFFLTSASIQLQSS